MFEKFELFVPHADLIIHSWNTTLTSRKNSSVNAKTLSIFHYLEISKGKKKQCLKNLNYLCHSRSGHSFMKYNTNFKKKIGAWMQKLC